jgi:hypothetical protein
MGAHTDSTPQYIVYANYLFRVHMYKFTNIGGLRKNGFGGGVFKVWVAGFFFGELELGFTKALIRMS